MTVIAHIEDCDVDHLLLEKLLEDKYEVVWFSCLKDFLDAKQEFDLIISDLRLPESYGYETVDGIRADYPDTPLLVLTGMGGSYMTGDIFKAFIDRGADNVVSKDILRDPHLLSLIEELLAAS